MEGDLSFRKAKEINKRQGQGNVFLLCSILNSHVVFNFLCSFCYHIVHNKVSYLFCAHLSLSGNLHCGIFVKVMPFCVAGGAVQNEVFNELIFSH